MHMYTVFSIYIYSLYAIKILFSCCFFLSRLRYNFLTKLTLSAAARFPYSAWPEYRERHNYSLYLCIFFRRFEEIHPFLGRWQQMERETLSGNKRGQHSTIDRFRFLIRSDEPITSIFYCLVSLFSFNLYFVEIFDVRIARSVSLFTSARQHQSFHLQWSERMKLLRTFSFDTVPATTTEIVASVS